LKRVWSLRFNRNNTYLAPIRSALNVGISAHPIPKPMTMRAITFTYSSLK